MALEDKVLINKNTLEQIGDKYRTISGLPSEGVIRYETKTVFGIATKKAMSDLQDPETASFGNLKIPGYSNSRNTTTVITIPGATGLHIKITYATEGASYDYVMIYKGTDTSGTTVAEKLGGTTQLTREYDVTDTDSVTFHFISDRSNNNWIGYYAEISSINEVEYEVQVPIYGPINRIDGAEIPVIIDKLLPDLTQTDTNMKSWSYDAGNSNSYSSLSIPIDFKKVVCMLCYAGATNSSGNVSGMSNGTNVVVYIRNFPIYKIDKGNEITAYGGLGTAASIYSSSNYGGLVTPLNYRVDSSGSNMYFGWIGVKPGDNSFTLTTYYSTTAPWNTTSDTLKAGYFPTRAKVVIVYEP